MTVRDDLNPLVDSARSIVVAFGLRRRGVSVRTFVTTGSGLTATTVATDVELTPTPKVSDLSRNVSTIAGIAEIGDFRVSKISTSYTRDELDPGGSSVWVVDEGGAEPVLCRLVKLEMRNFEWRATLVRMDRP